MKSNKVVHVAVGVVKDDSGNILISLRPESVHQGGLWEFPGGKIEAGESVEQALRRELKEELNISIEQFKPLIQVKHDYSDLSVLLDVWLVTQFSGIAEGLEQQEIKWLRPEELVNYKFPEANYPIITAARLPEQYAILNGDDVTQLLQQLDLMIENGAQFVQARIKGLSTDEVRQFLETVIPKCKEKGITLLVNSAVKIADEIIVDGIHLTSFDLLACKKRPANYQWVAASCHNTYELQHAVNIGVDFVVLAPVLPTQSHPDTEPLGWDMFSKLVAEVNLPVYALGGMTIQDISTAQTAGAQGIAGISAFLEN